MCGLLGIPKGAKSSFYLNVNGGTKPVYESMAKMPAMIINDEENDRDLPISHHVEFAYESSVGAPRGSAPNEVHMGYVLGCRSPPLSDPVPPATRAQIVTSSATVTWPVIASNEPTKLCEHYSLTVTSFQRRNCPITDARLVIHTFKVGDWVCIFTQHSRYYLAGNPE